MFAKHVKVTYNGVEFTVSVCCTPYTPIEELERRALQTIVDAFNRYGITVCE